MANHLKKIGILGGPGSGKSSVAEIFAEMGCGIINADKLNHQVLNQPAIIEKVVEIWGSDVVDLDGKVNRGKLGQLLFSSGPGIDKLMEIVHPEIFRMMNEQIAAFEDAGQVKAIVMDVPLLMEVGWEKNCDILVFVKVDDSVRRSRLKKIRNWDENFIKNIENSQILLDNKEQISDYIVENSSDISNLRFEVERIFPEMLL